jgi:adenosylcobinamide-GDP ribazoletransferase
MRLERRTASATERSAPRLGEEIVAAVGMLTRIPVRRAALDTSGAAAFGLVGALVGGLGAVPVVLLGGLLPTLAAVLAIGTMALVSGAIHLDGLADTADALLASDPTRAEAARKDPAIGSGGAVALVLVLAMQVAALASITSVAGAAVAGLACIASGAASRSLPVVGVAIRGQVPLGVGLGAWFSDRTGMVEAATVVLCTVLAAVLIGLVAGSAALTIGVAVGFALGLGSSAVLLRMRGQLDGDLMGATVELGLAATLVATAVALAVAWPTR